MTRRPAGNEGGFTYIAAMVAVIIMGITLGSAATFWSTRMQREREEELLFRGIQYRDAIRAWYGYVWDPKSKTFKQDGRSRTRRGLPEKAPNLTDLEQLLKDPNSGGKVRHIRRLFSDPVASFFTGKEEKWATVKGVNQQIVGVKSTSDKKPLKQGNFPDDPAEGLHPQDFENKEKYSEWEFRYDRFPTPAAEGKQSGRGIGDSAQ